MTEIKMLHPEAKPPRAEVVKIASELMNDIAAGKIDGVAMVALCRDGSIINYITPTEDYFRVMGALSRLMHRLQLAGDKTK